jgi:acetyl esterase/lipase
MLSNTKKSILKALSFAAALGLFFVSFAFSQEEFIKAKVVYQVPGMDKVKVFSDITYKEAGGKELKMDIFQPANLKPGDKFPAVLYIHGGTLPPDYPVMPKDWGQYLTHGRLIAASGFVAVTFNHRYFGVDKQNLDNSFSDVRDAIMYVRENAKKYNIDPDRICLWSVSGGGSHLSVALQDKMEYVRCIVSYYSVLNLKSLMSSYGGRNLDWMNGYAPVDYLTFENYNIPPFFVARAGLDDPTLNGTIDEFIAKALEMNIDIEVANHPSGLHGFDVFNDNQRTKEIIEDTISFIKRNLYAEKTGNEQLVMMKGRLLKTIQNGYIQNVRDIIEGRSGNFSENQRAELKSVLSEQALNGIGYALIGTGNSAKAVELFKWIVEMHPESINALDSLADGYEAAGSTELAIESSEKAIELLNKAVGMDESRKNNIKKAIEDRLKRLKK